MHLALWSCTGICVMPTYEVGIKFVSVLTAFILDFDDSVVFFVFYSITGAKRLNYLCFTSTAIPPHA
jgi:hypothetical protein